MSDKDNRAQFDRGEIDGDGNPANPFAGMGGGGGFRPNGGQRGYRTEDFQGFGGEEVDSSLKGGKYFPSEGRGRNLILGALTKSSLGRK